MNTREQFGKYLLLKKLTEDPLGETFRAGMLGPNGMERVALLRVFNGQGVDGQRLWQATQGRVAVQQLLRSPNLGEGVEMGEIQGLPYVAYDYISGKNLATLLEQAAKKRNFVPTEHALLITERLALGLAVACESRHEGQRILHGFVAPHLLMISNEGETRLLGFEVGPGLRSFAANPVIRQHFGRYLAPEALAGAAPHRADDIYSLGVILFELLTGKPLPPPAQDGFASIIDKGLLATEGTPIPPELANLLKRSLVAREHRVDDVVAWHKALNKWMFDGQYNPTTFNLAFFMHNLFRQDIERESQEIEVEKTLPLPVQTPAAAAASAAEPPPPPPAAAAEGTGVGPAPIDEKTENFIPEYAREPKSSKTGLFIGIAAAVALIAAGGGYTWWSSQQQGDGEATQTAATQPPPAVTPPPPEPVEPAEEVPSGPTPDQINEQIKSLIAERASDMEEALRKQYDQQLVDLQKELEAAKDDAEERQQREQELADEQARQAEEAAKLAEAEAAAAAAEEPALEEAAETEPAAEAELQVAEQQEPLPEEVAPPPVSPPPPTPAPPAQVRRGDLVEPGPGVKLPELVRRPNPRFPSMARRLNRSGATVLVRVLVDENGKVVKTELAGKEQGFGFDTEAINAARRSSYKPATKDGVPVKIWHTLTIQFKK